MKSAGASFRFSRRYGGEFTAGAVAKRARRYLRLVNGDCAWKAALIRWADINGAVAIAPFTFDGRRLRAGGRGHDDIAFLIAAGILIKASNSAMSSSSNIGCRNTNSLAALSCSSSASCAWHTSPAETTVGLPNGVSA